MKLAKMFLASVLVLTATLDAKAEHAVVKPTAVLIHEHGCGGINFAPGNFNEHGRLIFDTNTGPGKAMYATALAAVAAGKTMTVFRDRRSPSCWGISDFVAEIVVHQ